MIGAGEALELGLVDHVLEPVEFLDDSIELLLRRIEAGEGKRTLDADLSDVADVVRRRVRASTMSSTARRRRPTARSS